MNPFSPDSKCVKCGLIPTGLRPTKTHYDIFTAKYLKGVDGKERIGRTCPRCQYQWDEAPLDQSPSSKKKELVRPRDKKCENCKHFDGGLCTDGHRFETSKFDYCMDWSPSPTTEEIPPGWEKGPFKDGCKYCRDGKEKNIGNAIWKIIEKRLFEVKYGITGEECEHRMIISLCPFCGTKLEKS